MRWIFALIGYLLFRFPGAVLGFFIGSLFENTSVQTSFRRTRISTQDFELKLLTLAGLVIKADGKVTQKELDYVRRYFVSAYGKERANEVFRVFNSELNKSDVSALEVCSFFALNARYESRLQLVHFLFGIAQADGSVSEPEWQKIQSFAGYLKVRMIDFESIKAMFVKQVDSAYKILEVSRSATDSQIKKAYRDLAKKHHPDKVQHLGEAYVKAAREKFQQIQKAYEQIKSERGF
jgi:DnaJ like chaperone protein